jgi:signal transduction histidine kinase
MLMSAKKLLGAALALCAWLGATSHSHAQSLKPTGWEIRITPKGQEKSDKWISIASNPEALKIKREFQGTIEYRASFDAVKKTAESIGIYLGQVGEVDRVFVNDHFVGQTGGFPPDYKNFSDVFREYLIHGDSLNHSTQNQLYIEVYSQYVGIKGIKIQNVEIGDHFELQKKQYWSGLFFTLVRVGIPTLCLFLAFLFMPWFSTSNDKPQNAIVPIVALAAFFYGLGNSRVLFHLLDDFVAYKVLVISALTGWVFAYLYGLRSAKLKSKLILGLLISCQVAFPAAMILSTNYTLAIYIAKVWIAVSLPLSLLVTGYIVLKGKSEHWPIKVTVVFLSLITANDVLHALRFIQTAIVIDLGFSVVLLAFMSIQIMNYKKGFYEYAEKRAQYLWGEKFLNLARQVAHDIRSPLQTMVFAAQDLKARSSLHDDFKSSPINILQLGLARINSILGKLISEFRGPEDSSQTANRSQPRLTLVDKCIREILMEHRWSDERSVSFVVEGIDTLAPTWGVIEPSELQTAISNVIRNANESFEKSPLKRKDRKISVQVVSDSRFLNIAVSDNGCGIPQENLGKLFERGFTAGKAMGTGLGLAQVNEALEKIEGSVTVESTVGTGTTVTLRVPIESAPKFVTDTIEYKRDSIIYFVDDDPTVQQVWRNLIAASRIDARKSLIRSSPRQLDGDGISESATLVIDHYYRGDSLSGLDWLKAQSPFAPRRVYLCTTAFDDPEVQAEAVKLGIKIVPKPLIDKVRFLENSPEQGVQL